MTTVRYLNALNAWEGTILQALQGNASVLLVQDVFLLRSTPYMIHKLEYEDSRPAFIEAHQVTA